MSRKHVVRSSIDPEPEYRIPRLIILLVVVAIVAIIVALCVPNQPDVAPRSKISRTRSDMRTLATALEAYYIDHASYPGWTDRVGQNVFVVGNIRHKATYDRLPTFMNYRPGLATLTTPVAYISTHFADPYGLERDEPFCYWAPKDGGWILWSAGPDGQYDLTMDNIAQAYDVKKPAPNDYLLSLTYDPTNGPASGGDVYRVKQ